MELFDSHCHIQSAGQPADESGIPELWAKAGDVNPDDIITRAEQAGVTRLICVGCDLKDSQLAVSFASQQPNCWASVGLHPHETNRYLGQAADLDQFKALATAPEVVAIGECGLDYHYDHSPKATQTELLKFQIELALELDLPIVFHIREAFADFWPIFESYHNSAQPLRGVVHSFSDSSANLERAVSAGLMIGVNGIATFTKNSDQLEVYRQIPVENLVLETDAPFLAPIPYRGEICEPRHIKTIAEYLVELRGESMATLATATTNNARRLFGL
jgi:TatD DNase family protein